MDIPENLKRVRKENNLSQAELAKAVGISQSMLAQLERGTKNLTINLALDIAKALNISLNELIS